MVEDSNHIGTKKILESHVLMQQLIYNFKQNMKSKFNWQFFKLHFLKYMHTTTTTGIERARDI